MMADLSSMGRSELEAKYEAVLQENRLMLDNLHATQARCTTLLQECRAYKRNAPLEGYREAAQGTSSHNGERFGADGTMGRGYERVVMACFGLAGESGETIDYLKKVFFHSHKLDEVKLKKEIGDVLWYLAELCSAFGFSLQEIADLNIEKLAKRYQGQFSAEKSQNRTDEEEHETA